MYNKSNIQDMFDALAPNYDIMNTMLSLGFHSLWNRNLVHMLGASDHLLDLCAGTGKVALQYIRTYPQASGTLVDFSKQMLLYVQKKYPHAPFTYICKDIETLPFTNNSQKKISMAYGLRNLKNPLPTLQEIHRVTHPRGTFGILELTKPQSFCIHYIHKFYLNYLVPWLGKHYAHNRSAYEYLNASIKRLPYDPILEGLFREAGFVVSNKKKLLFGTATIWILKKS